MNDNGRLEAAIAALGFVLRRWAQKRGGRPSTVAGILADEAKAEGKNDDVVTLLKMMERGFTDAGA